MLKIISNNTGWSTSLTSWMLKAKNFMIWSFRWVQKLVLVFTTLRRKKWEQVLTTNIKNQIQKASSKMLNDSNPGIKCVVVKRHSQRAKPLTTNRMMSWSINKLTLNIPSTKINQTQKSTLTSTPISSCPYTKLLTAWRLLSPSSSCSLVPLTSASFTRIWLKVENKCLTWLHSWCPWSESCLTFVKAWAAPVKLP